MRRTLMTLCDEIKITDEDFIKKFTEQAYNDYVNTAVLIGDKSILRLIQSIKTYYKKTFGNELNLNVLILQDLDDTDYLFERFNFKIKEFPNDDILISITHGSNKVSAVALLISKLYGLKIQDKKLIEDTSTYSHFEVIEQSTISNKPLYYVKKLFNNYDFKIAKEILLSSYNPRNKTEKMFNIIIDIYKKWDSFNYERYEFEEIESYFTNLEELPANKKAIEILMDHNHEKYNTYKIADILNNAKRRIHEERYDDAIIRLYRVLELIGEVRLKEKYGMRKTDIHINDINELNIDNKSKNNIKKRLNFKYPRYEIPLTTTYFILQKLNDRVGDYYSKNKGKFQELFQKRNISVLIHGDNKYTPEEINEMLERVTDLALVYDRQTYKAMEEMKFPKFKI